MHTRNTPVGKLKRAQIIRLASQGQLTPEIAKQLKVSECMVHQRLKRFNEQGLQGLEEVPRSGRPVTYTPEEVSSIIQTALSNHRDVGEDYAMWTLDRLVEHLHRVKGIRMQRSRISEIFIAEGLSWRHEESWFGDRVDPAFAKIKGAIELLYTIPPPNSARVCLDQMGPVAVKSYAGKQLVHAHPTVSTAAERAKQEIETFSVSPPFSWPEKHSASARTTGTCCFSPSRMNSCSRRMWENSLSETSPRDMNC